MPLFHKKLLKHDFSSDAEDVLNGLGLLCSERSTLLRALPCSRPLQSGLTTGFSAVELIVAVGIFLILTVTLLFNYGSFNGRVTVDMLAHQIATWVHDAQVSAMSIRRSRTGISPEEQFRSGYGLFFDLMTPNKFIYFADLDRNRVYTPLPPGKKCGDPSVECEQEVSLLQGNVVSLICGDKPLAAEPANCASATPGNPLLYTTNTLNIVFVRPDPFTASIWGDTNTAYAHAEITVASPKGYRHTITVWITGQVSVR